MSRARDLADGTFSGAFSADSPTLVVDAANNRVGVGTTTPNATIHVAGQADGDVQIRLAEGANRSALDNYTLSGLNFTAYQFQSASTYRRVSDIAGVGDSSWGGILRFSTNPDGSSTSVERARIHSGGQLSLFTTGTTVGGKGCRFTLDQDNASGYAFGVDRVRNTNDSGGILIRNGDTQGTMYAVSFFNTSNSHVGSIVTSNGGTSFNTSSDYRLKENVIELTGAIDRVKQVPVHRFNFIAEPDKTVDGFLAHEVQSIVPEAVHGEKDAMTTQPYEITPAVIDDDGNVVTEAVMGTREVIDPQGIDQSKLVPLLTAAIKEQQALIEDLQTRLAALENA